MKSTSAAKITAVLVAALVAGTTAHASVDTTWTPSVEQASRHQTLNLVTPAGFGPPIVVAAKKISGSVGKGGKNKPRRPRTRSIKR